MDRVILNFTANQQRLEGKTYLFASNTVRYIQAVFDLGENWQGYDSIRAVWYSGSHCIATVLDSRHSCLVPVEVLARIGKVKMNLVGSIADGDELTDRLTTYPIDAIIVDKNARVVGTETAPITPSQFEQFAEAVHEDAERAAASEQGAEAAQSAAESARDAARDAQTGAETAQGLAEDAQEAAESARDAAQTAQEAAETAQGKAEDAQAAAEEAQDKAEQAAADAGYMFFHIDENGHLIMEHTQNVDDIDFELVNGHLILEVA